MKPGDLMRIIEAPDQALWNQFGGMAGKICLLIRNLEKSDGSPFMWEVLIDGRLRNVHKLDLGKIDETG
jgi:hypothetical protein